MKVKASLKNLRMSPRKVRLVTRSVVGMNCAQALIQLQNLVKKTSNPLEKLLRSAIANAENNFGLDKDNLFVGNIQAAGVGLTLTAASNTCFLELPWSPAIVLQAEDRCHRIGQTAESVTAWYLLAADTMDEEIMQLIDAKLKVITKVMDGQDVEDESLVSELLKKYTKGE